MFMTDTYNRVCCCSARIQGVASILFTLMSASLVFPMIWQREHFCPLRIPSALGLSGCGLPLNEYAALRNI
jgi:hypothetical protein